MLILLGFLVLALGAVPYLLWITRPGGEVDRCVACQSGQCAWHVREQRGDYPRWRW